MFSVLVATCRPSGAEAPQEPSGGGHPVTDALEETVTGLNGLLGGQREPLEEAPRLLPEDASAE